MVLFSCVVILDSIGLLRYPRCFNRGPAIEFWFSLSKQFDQRCVLMILLFSWLKSRIRQSVGLCINCNLNTSSIFRRRLLNLFAPMTIQFHGLLPAVSLFMVKKFGWQRIFWSYRVFFYTDHIVLSYCHVSMKWYPKQVSKCAAFFW